MSTAVCAESAEPDVSLSDEHMSNRTLSFLIEGQLWAQPLPISLYLSTDLDLETGTTTVTETTG